ncbi:hypothetical protein [Clostridium sp. JS66]|nr:hypothetical protein [Clostridium sp. JS66]WPC43649.1 hypothetical protein Q6H37_09300 [Clostridium sp. JS66]
MEFKEIKNLSKKRKLSFCFLFLFGIKQLKDTVIGIELGKNIVPGKDF